MTESILHLADKQGKCKLCETNIYKTQEFGITNEQMWVFHLKKSWYRPCTPDYLAVLEVMCDYRY